jgi:dolichol-phosphate mannosyltransferase
MQATEQAARPANSAVSLVLQASPNLPEVEEAIRRAADLLTGEGRDYEILVVGSNRDEELARAIRAEQAAHAHVRWLACADPENFRAVLHAGAAAARFDLVVFAPSGLAAGGLDDLFPLASRFPIVSGYRVNRRGPLKERLASWSHNAVSRFLLGTQVRDCESGLLLFQRSALAEVLPETDGRFAGAEVLVRARRCNLTVVEVPVRPRSEPHPARRRLRDLPRAAAALVSFWWSAVLFAGRPAAAPHRSSWLLGVAVMALAALLLFPELNHPLLDPDEGRQAEIPREMLAHDDWLTPRMLGLPYYEKPPLQYWLTACAYTVFGVRPWTARLVPAVAAWLTVLLTFAWGKRALGTRTAFLGCLGLCLSLGFIFLGRTVVLDSLLTACVTAAWFAGHRAVRGPTLHRGWWLMSALACGLGILAKGPVALVLLVPPVAAYAYLTRGAARPRWYAWLGLAGAALAVAAPWYTAMALTEPGYLNHFLWRNNVVRYLDAYDHQHAWWFYVPVLFASTLPWSLLWAWLVYFLFSRHPRLVLLRGPGLGFCTLAAGWSLLFFSLAGCKSPPYLAPVLVPLALLHGACLDAILFRRVGRRDRFLGFARQWLPYRATLAVLAFSLAAYLTTGILGWEKWGWVLLELALTLAAGAAWWKYGRRLSPPLAWAACAAATLTMVVGAARDLVAGFATRHTVGAIAKVARRWPGMGGLPVVSYGRQWPSASFYLRRDQVTFFDRGNTGLLVEFLRSQPGALVLVESGEPLEEVLRSLPPGLEAEVRLPEREGQAALVVVRPRTAPGLARRE